MLAQEGFQEQHEVRIYDWSNPFLKKLQVHIEQAPERLLINAFENRCF